MRYLRHLARHPLHLAVLALLATVAIWSSSVLGALAAALVELAVLLTMPRVRTFRLWVDRHERAAEALRAVAARADLLARLDEAHRRELRRLERLVDAIRERVRYDLGLGEMLAVYVGGATTFATARARWTTDRAALAYQIAALERAAESSDSAALRDVATERLHVARLRIDRCDRSRDDLDLLEQQLGLLADVIGLVYDDATIPLQPRAMERALRGGLASVEEAAQVTRELARNLDGDALPDARIFELASGS